jgi:hypothetical protein
LLYSTNTGSRDQTSLSQKVMEFASAPDRLTVKTYNVQRIRTEQITINARNRRNTFFLNSKKQIKEIHTNSTETKTTNN